MSHLDRLEQLGKLRASGVLSEEEFQREKARILAERNAPPRRAEPVPPYLRDTPPTAREPMPDSGMAWAILTTLFCFFPFGVVAIVKASQVAGHWYAGNPEAAREAAQSANNWSIASLAVGVVLGIVVLGLSLAGH